MRTSPQAIQRRLLTFNSFQMVEYALRTLSCTLLWNLQSLDMSAMHWDEQKTQIERRRDTLLAALEEFAVGNHSNAAEDVRKEVSVQRLGV